VPGCSARAGAPHDEVTKGIVEFLDVREDAHGALHVNARKQWAPGEAALMVAFAPCNPIIVGDDMDAAFF